MDGNINTNDGYVAVTASTINVASTANINTHGGSVMLGAGAEGYTLSLNGNSKVMYTTTAGTMGQINAAGHITTGGGNVSMVTSVLAKDIKSSVINLTGVIDTSNLTAGKNGGAVTLASTGMLNTSADSSITANGGKNGGAIKFTSTGAATVDGNLTSIGHTNGGAINIKSASTLDFEGNILTQGNNAGGNITITTAKNGFTTNEDSNALQSNGAKHGKATVNGHPLAE